MTDEEFEAKKAELREHLDDPERAVKEVDGFTFGERVRVLEDDEEEGVFEGDEGVVLIEKVGAAKYGNERAAVFLKCDGRDPVEITMLEVESC